ncbi:sigma-54 dependent transcriptional regulator [Bdellovibrionota bacterium FG-2]
MTESSAQIWVLDDEKNITFVIRAMLEKAGYCPVVFNDSVQALSELKKSVPEVLITDLYMPGPGGMEVLEYCKKHCPQVPVVIITAYGTIETAVSALKQGAFDFITKPFEQTELLNVVQKAVQTYRQRQKEPVFLFSENGACESTNTGTSIVGQSAPMQEVLRVIGKIAVSPSTVLILGESGTGKELVAYEIHRLSPRVAKPFVKINCAAIPATLIESELFGHEKGAFTGAVASRPGRFELAHEGTLFLDEVAEMPLEMQVKLLRVLQEQEFQRVGGVATVKVDVRIITATNRDIEAEVKAGRFREDLYYRLNVVPIRLPALRDRREDIDPLIKFFLQQFNTKLGKQITAVMPDVLASLRQFSWPGNIRHLENVIERMVVMCEGSVLNVEDLPEEIPRVLASPAEIQADESVNHEPVSFKDLVKKQTQFVERELIEKALEETAGNVTRAAEKLGLSRKGLQIKIKELGLKRPID